jgi:hypothetical protein
MSDQKQAHVASLIISIIILIIVIILIIIVCCNWNNLNNTQTQQRVQNPQALAAAAMYKKNQGNKLNAAMNAIENNPQKALLGAYAYNQKNNFANQGVGVMCAEGDRPVYVGAFSECTISTGGNTNCNLVSPAYTTCIPNNGRCAGGTLNIIRPPEICNPNGICTEQSAQTVCRAPLAY